MTTAVVGAKIIAPTVDQINSDHITQVLLLNIVFNLKLLFALYSSPIDTGLLTPTKTICRSIQT